MWEAFLSNYTLAVNQAVFRYYLKIAKIIIKKNNVDEENTFFWIHVRQTLLILFRVSAHPYFQLV